MRSRCIVSPESLFPIPMGGLADTITKRMFLLRHDVLDHRPVDIGQTEISAGVSVGELFVIKAEQLEHRSVQIVDVNFIFDGFEAELVGRSVNVPSFYPTAGQPGGEAPVVVVAAVNFTGV